MAQENPDHEVGQFTDATVCGIGLYYGARSTIMAEQND
jgi:hypothetical protein